MSLLHAIYIPAAAQRAGLWLREEDDDDGCAAWLEGHEDLSVVYMNLGSLTVKLRLQRAEFLLHGLAAAGYAFLCVLRPDMVHQTSEVLQEAGDAVAGASERAGDGGGVCDYAVHRPGRPLRAAAPRGDRGAS